MTTSIQADKAEKANFLSTLRRIFWPIEWHENKKFIPMALMMLCILFNYSTLRSIKDGLVVTQVGPEAVSFLKLYVVVPFAIFMMIVYAKLCNMMSQQSVFYTVTSFFLTYFALFAFVLYPNTDFFHPSVESVNSLIEQLPRLKWFIKIGAHWTYASFYMMSELWGAMMVTLLFWQFANQITQTNEAKRFYSMFGLLGNLALPITGAVIYFFLHKDTNIVAEEVKLIPILCLTIASGVCIIFLYGWINRNVLTDPTLYDASKTGSVRTKTKLSLVESFKMIITSKYLGLILILVLSYGISMVLVENVWKAQVGKMYPSVTEYTAYMGMFQAYQGTVAIIFMLIGSNILRNVSWTTSALFTPIMILITGFGFFWFILFGDSQLSVSIAAFFLTGPIGLVVTLGLIQNVLSKGVKYSLFDSTKEMSYIPLDDEMKTKGKAAVDVIGGRLGKSGGGFIISTFLLIMPNCSLNDLVPYIAPIFFFIIITWIFAARALGRAYQAKLAERQ